MPVDRNSDTDVNFKIKAYLSNSGNMNTIFSLGIDLFDH